MPGFGTPFEGINLDRKLNKEELVRALRFVTAAEFEAVQLYQQLAAASNDAGSQKVLLDIANEEIVHAGEFMALIKKLAPEEEKLYEEGEDEVKKLLKAAHELDKISSELQEQAPGISLALDRLSDKIESLSWHQN